MKFTEKYTTQFLIDKDKEGLEAKKCIVSCDAYATGEMLQNLDNTIENLRLTIRMDAK